MEIKMVKKKVSDLKPDPNQPRKLFKQEDINLLAQTYQAQGIINPIEIDENNVIITGEIRWRASKQAILEEIDCKLLLNITEKEKRERQIIENEHHQKLTAEERENAIYHLWEIGNYKNQEELGILLGISGKRIEEIIKAKETRTKLKKEIPNSKKASSIPSYTMTQIGSLNRNDQIKIVEKAEKEQIPNFELRKLVTEIKKLPNEVKEEILKPETKITLEDAKFISDFPKQEQRKQVMNQIKQTKQTTQRILERESKIAKNEEKAPINAIINIDQKQIDKMLDIYHKIALEYRNETLKQYSAETQKKCIEIMRKAYKFIFDEVEKYGKRESNGIA